MGGQTKRQFSTKNDATGQKNDFFEIFFSVAHLPIKKKLLCFYQIFISSVVREIMGGTKRVTNEQTTNKQTPQTIIRPRQDSQNPRANK